ncbi:MAG: hypothetical protein HC837_08155 [Chloroflexaceae bacterium]|nr:hypothetical protein [Chloroflexaceae bacterium]
MKRVSIYLPEEVLATLSLNDAELTGLAYEALLVRLCVLGEISAEQAAQILGMPPSAFQIWLERYLVPVYSSTPSYHILKDSSQSYSLLELEGQGSNLWHDVNAQSYVDSLRNEWSS